MSATNAFETAILQLLFTNTNAANVGDATGLLGSTTAGSFFISLHTADPGETGNQSASEATYTGYARIAVARSGAGWTVLGNTASNVAAINFGSCTAGSSTVTHFGIGSDSVGTGNLFFKGSVSPAIAITAGITPSFPIGSLTVTDD